MVSFREAILLEKKMCHNVESFFSKKRKKRDEEESEGLFAKEMRLEKGEKEEEVGLSLDAPFLSNWQGWLDIKSGRIDFYETRAERRTPTDPWLSLDTPANCPLGLDLELNLATRDSPPIIPPALPLEKPKTDRPRPKSQRGAGFKALSFSSWISPAAFTDSESGEMVAAACARCHMLVMMSKPALSCPNCKFVNPPDLSFSAAIKPQVNIWRCKE
ncbi:uncharacterized protein LOC141840240 [Curcuma longa]|uniref:uncharacterized protein LOC141840240 n=1 Tax=Curcuma longa TaxID=136217 RepID=UPI003D9F6775